MKFIIAPSVFFAIWFAGSCFGYYVIAPAAGNGWLMLFGVVVWDVASSAKDVILNLVEDE